MEAHEKFICNIFDQPLEKAYRRSRIYWAKTYDDWIKYKRNVPDVNTLSFGGLIKAIARKIKRKITRK